MTEGVRIVPANEVPCVDLLAVFGTRGAAATCFCQRYKLHRGEAFSTFPARERSARLLEQARCGDSSATTTSGLVAYADGEAAGWCAVEPRSEYFGLARAYRVPWDGRDEDRTDPDIWSVTCVLVRPGYRRRGIAHVLAQAAVEHARSRGARALEAYPMRREAGEISWDEIHVGAQSVFESAGMREISRPGKRRAVMRVDFAPSTTRTHGDANP